MKYLFTWWSMPLFAVMVYVTAYRPELLKFSGFSNVLNVIALVYGLIGIVLLIIFAMNSDDEDFQEKLKDLARNKQKMFAGDLKRYVWRLSFLFVVVVYVLKGWWFGFVMWLFWWAGYSIFRTEYKKAKKKVEAEVAEQ